MTADMRIIIKETVQETIREMFLAMGINIADADGTLALQRDMHYLRINRMQSEMNKNKAWQKGIELVLSGLAAAVLLGLVQLFSGSR